ncbi:MULTISPECIES: pitrilysin family protein [unclassified Massilia]|uniref:M16 family metallopeptidase n=1 Tax=unclassified Massilia TaxID=2609279 RepID=UPI00177BD435|nr:MULTISPECIES: M16 family metallopeptidase [unclassified Massilia]MBD8532259.1 insulinase family protein [Massilia sp. CFBP 13647]MBD8675666.1 insulinase family protein [Massilia sp. CFBP 13721]
MFRHILRHICLAAVLLTHSFVAGATLKLDAPIPVGPQVKVGKLANGLTWYIQKNTRPERRLELRLVIKAGSILEDEDQQGLAHFVEHMAFNGSTNFKQHELVGYLQSIGVKFGADLNATTSFDETVYILPIPLDRPENLKQAFRVLEDWAHGITFDDAAIDKERGIVLEELRLGKGAGDRIGKRLYPKIFNGSRYAERLPIGKEEVLRTFKPDALRRYYRDWYRPDLMAVVAVGDVDPKTIESLVKAHFSKLKNPAPARPRVYAGIPRREETEAVVVTDREAGGNSILVRYPVQPVREPDTVRGYRQQMVEGLFGGMLSARLQELSQLPEPPFLRGGSGVGSLTPFYKSFNASASIGPGGAPKAIAALVRENERVRRYGFGAAELERARKDMLRSYERLYNEREKTDSRAYVAEYMRNFLQNEPIPGIAAEYRYATELLPGVTLDEINAYARRTIPADSGKLVIYTGIEQAATPPPSGESLLAALAAAEQAEVAPYEEKSLATQLLAQPPASGSIVAEREDKALGLTYLTLSNGVKVILKPTDFRNDQVVMSAARFGGQSLYGDADIVNARYANGIVASMGLKEFSPLDLSKVLAGKAAAVTFGLAGYSEVVGASSGATDIETMLQLLWLRFDAVRRDEDLFKSFIGKQVEAARNRLAQPGARFGDTIAATLYGNHPRAPRPLRPEEFAQIDLDRSIAIYRERFSSAKDLTFVMVGSFDPKKVRPLLATYLGSLPTPDIPTAWRDVGLRPVKGVVKRAVYSGAEPKSTISLTFTGEAPFSEAEQMRLQALVEVLNIRIIEVLREQLSMIYGGSAGGQLARIPYGHYTLSVNLPTGPENVDKVLAATFAEFERLKREGPSATDLAKVKQNWIQNYRRALRENGYWLGRIQSALLDGTDPAAILTHEERVNALAASEVQEAAQRYLNTENYVQVVLYPEKKAEAPVQAAAAQETPVVPAN